MRQLCFVAGSLVAGLGFACASHAAGSPLIFTLDLTAPCTAGGCDPSIVHPTDIGVQALADSFNYAQDGTIAGTPFVATLAVETPLVCDEIDSGSQTGAVTSQQFSPSFSNAAPGSQLEFNAGGPTLVDLGAISYDGTNPAGVAGSYANYGVVLPAQVICYRINQVSGGAVALAIGPGGIFVDGFEGSAAHFGDEPWVSVQTVYSPSAAGASQSRGSSVTNGITPNSALGYVVRIHNAASAVGWRLNLGYDSAFFDPANNGMVAPKWCVLGSSIPQPGALSGSATCNTVQSAYTLNGNDIQLDTNSVYIYVEDAGSSAASSNWSTLTSGTYPATASLFPPFKTYPRRFDDKSAVAARNNLPVLNVSGIVCNNTTGVGTCVLADQDGNAIPPGGQQGQLVTTASIDGAGNVSVNPLAYYVDPNGGTTLPGTGSGDALAVSGVTCDDPSGILASPLSTANFTASNGSTALGFGFAASGSPDYPYVAGTATCTATFTAPGTLALARTHTFTITMNQALLGSAALTAPTGPVAPGSSQDFTLVVANAGSGTLSNMQINDAGDANFSIASWTCSGSGVSCPNASGSGALSETVASVPAGASLTYVLTGTVAAAPSPADQITNAATIGGFGGSCTGGNCTASASVATVPILAITLDENPISYTTNGDPVTYTITLTNSGGTDVTGAALADPAVAGLTFGTWTCAAVGTNSACPNAGGSGAIGESNIAVAAAGGTVTYTLPATVSVSSGNVTNTATLTLTGNAICTNGTQSCQASQVLTGP